ncbi:MAG: O-antigen polymerase [Ginsengibacter sp.]
MGSLDNIFIELIFVLLHLFLFITNFLITGKKIMHPGVLFSFTWFVVLCLHFIFSFTVLDQLFPISISTYLIIFIGTVAFCFGAFVQTVRSQKDVLEQNQINTGNQGSGTKINRTLQYVLLAIIIIGLPFYIKAAYQVYIASNIDNFFAGLRTELTYGDEDIGITKYLVSFSIVVFAVNQYAFFTDRNNTNRIILIVNLLVTLTYAVFVTGRGLFLMILLVYAGLSFFHNKNFSIKKIGYFFLLFLLFFISIGIMYGKGGDKEDSVKENLYAATQSTAIYLVSSINALDWERQHQFHVNYNGNSSLRFFVKLGKQFNLIPNAKVNELVQPFVFIPYPTNVYTIYSPYLKDFGIFYAWFMMFLFGFIHTSLYFKTLYKKDLRYSVYFSFLLFPLFMSFFQDQFLSLFSSWLQFVFYFELIHFFNKILVSKKESQAIKLINIQN